MEIFVIWLALSILAGIIANQKGRSGIGFFLLSLVLSPLVGIIAALVAGQNTRRVEEKQIASHENKRCPYCAEIIRKEAIVCRYCGKDLSEGLATTISASRPRASQVGTLSSGTTTDESTPQCSICGQRVVLSGFTAHMEAHRAEQRGR
jgi:hypothetical protein